MAVDETFLSVERAPRGLTLIDEATGRPVAEARYLGDLIDVGVLSAGKVKWLRGLTANELLVLRKAIDWAFRGAGYEVTDDACDCGHE